LEPVNVKPAPPRVRLRWRWMEMAVSLAALVTSAASITMAMDNNNSMERLVTANSWPFPLLDNSNFVDGKSNISLAIRNNGSGPAKLETLVVKYDGRVVQSAADIARACCVAPALSADELQAETGYLLSATPSGQVLLPGDSVIVLSAVRTEENIPFWDRLNQARYKLTFEACYCSVFDDCWTTNLQTTRPTPVAQCKPVEQIYKG
jgi:hypothetical protein